MTTYLITPFIDALIDDLQAVLPELSVARVHRYTPRSLERLEPDGDLHLAVWFSAEQLAEEALPLATGTRRFLHRYEVLLWQACSEAVDLVADEDGAREFLALVERVREQFLAARVRTLGGAIEVIWRGCEIEAGGGQGSTRYARITVEANFALDFA